MSEQLEPAWALHTRNYRDTSLLVEFFGRDTGRFSGVVKGARGRKPRFRGNVQPFVPMLVSCYGRHELKSVKSLEFSQPVPDLTGQQLYLGIYVNELLYRLLGRFDAVPALFDHYHKLLFQLALPQVAEKSLRSFELKLLAELGYGLSFDHDAETFEPVEEDVNYRFVPGQGFIAFHGVAESLQLFSGEHLLLIAEGELEREDVMLSAKKIVRSALHELLDGRPLNSRNLFKSVRSG